FWSCLTLIPIVYLYGPDVALYQVLHTYLLEFIPFILVAMVLYTISGGIEIQLSYPGSPLANSLFLSVTTLMASVIGTTGAAMLFIRPLLVMNKDRQRKTHLVVFFILLVCNIGGCLTALGDPPLFLGFLKGVPFFWPFIHLFYPFLIVSLPTLFLFFVADTYFYRSDKKSHSTKANGNKISIKGTGNLYLFLCVMLTVIVSGSWKPGISFFVYGVELELQDILRDILFVVFAYISMKITPKKIREYNLFSWDPIVEVAKLFACIFITATPVIAILSAGEKGALASLVSLVNVDGVPQNDMYFWLTGILSSFLDNAPTYLVFFFVAGGDAELLSGELSMTLTAISCGAVFMGALTYIGNAPNFLVKSIAEINGVAMPSFFAYAGLAMAILLPSFALLSYLMF
ncbi:MAG: sodium:proton antiporter, partial [Alphaproteobacteria bacterium]|nr:sodium:proton antiporter [Alphaproteobacteria bacterium]